VAGTGEELDSLKRAADALDAQVVEVTADDADVRRLARNARFSTAAEQGGGERWRDFGYWLVPPLAMMMLFWFRPGWMVRPAAQG
jgi:Ca-activated chloride channel family protein